MFKVTVRGPDGSETSYPLGADQGLIVGREETCDVVLPSKRVSRRHARFFTTEGKLFIEDLGSQNGVFVGGARIAGTAEIRPGPPIEIGEFNIRIRREDLSSAENTYAGTLQGIGNVEGSLLQLPPERGIVGRDDSADIVIYSDSVSRRHAELRNAGVQGYFIQDLGSANGTYVNGAKLTPKVERPLRPNDQIQFGDTAWLVVPRSALISPASEGSRRRFMLGTLLGLALLTGIVVYLLQHPEIFSPRGPGPKKAVVEEAPAIDRCHQAVSDGRWQEAQRACAEAYEEEPFVERRKLLRTAERELRFKDIFDDAKAKANIGDDRGALERYLAIEPTSYFFPRARLEVQQLSKGLMRNDLNSCRDAGRKHNNEKALETCKSYLRLQCHNGVDQEALKILRAAEKGKGGPPWKCPAELDGWFQNGTTTGPGRETFCGEKYSAKELCDAVMHFVKQEADDAVRTLAKVKRGTMDAEVAALKDDIVAVDGNYKSGQTKWASNDFVGAEKDYTVALEHDQRVLPAGESGYATIIKNKLADWYKSQGDHALTQGHLDVAFLKYTKAAVYRPKMNAFIDTLEQTAQERMKGSPTCDTVTAVLNSTRDSSKVHQDAQRKATDMHCGN